MARTNVRTKTKGDKTELFPQRLHDSRMVASITSNSVMCTCSSGSIHVPHRTVHAVVLFLLLFISFLDPTTDSLTHHHVGSFLISPFLAFDRSNVRRFRRKNGNC